MLARLTTLAAALIACTTPAWAATSNVDIYGVINFSVDTVSPAYGTYSAAADIGASFFTEPAFVPQINSTDISGQVAAISTPDYNASARTTLGSNHAYSQASAIPTGALGVSSFSGWYDQVTISGGTGTGTVEFSVQLNGTVTAGANLGVAGFGLLASGVHPTQLTSDTLTFNLLHTTTPWALDSDQVTEIALYDIVASPYNDPNQIAGLFGPSPSPAGIPAISDPSNSLGSGDGMGFPEYVPNLIFTPGANQAVNVILTGTLTFTYGEAFYLIGTLGTAVLGDGLEAFCTFDIGTECTPTPKDGIGVTALDFSNSAHLTGIVLPQGASFASASGAPYNVIAVPEPGEWLMLLAGLGLVGWRARRRA